MRCLYCGEPLSLLRKLTGKAEFCSEAHRVAYQDEFNSLALQRLASQPTQNRRAPTPFTLPSVPSEVRSERLLASEPHEPFAGFPFPEDPEDFDPPSHLPDFEQRFPESIPLDAEPPAPLWGLLKDGPLSANGEAPPTYSFPILLADYPRRYLMTNGVFHENAAGAVPFFGYVDLPEPLDDDSNSDAELLPEPFDPVTGWELPPWELLQASPNRLRAATILALPTGLTLAYEVGTLASLVFPDAERQTLPLLVQRSSRLQEVGGPLACLVPLDEISAQTGAATREFESTAQEGVDREAWCSSQLLLKARPEAATVSVCEFVAAAAPFDFDVQSHGYALSDAARVSIPECECFDAERSLVAPHLAAGSNPSMGDAGWLSLEAASSRQSRFGLPNSPDPLRMTGQPQRVPETRLGSNGCRVPMIPEGRLLRAQPGQACGVSEPAAAGPLNSLPWADSRVSTMAAAYRFSEGTLAEAGELIASGEMLAGVEVLNVPSDITWMAFSLPCLATRHSAAAGSAPRELLPSDDLSVLAFHVTALSPEEEAMPEAGIEPGIKPELSAPIAWISGEPATVCRLPLPSVSTLSKVRVKDFCWPEFAAGCESLFTPDQPFRFHELPFPPRGTTDQAAGDVLQCKLMQGLLLPYVDDRFGKILHSGLEAEVLDNWLDETANRAGNWPSAKPQIPAAGFPAESADSSINELKSAPAAKPPAPRVLEPPSSWQQAARAMHEGEQQVQREPHAPFPAPVPALPQEKARPVTAVPVISEPLSGFELTRMPAAQPPIPFQPGASPQNREGNRSPANDQPQFEWRREQPQPAPAYAPTGQAGSNITVNTTINVEGNADGVVVESAIRISLGNKKKKEDALEKFAEGENLDENRIRIAPLEDLPGFTAEAPELRAMLQPIAALADSVQWPKFSVTPMRRRIAFGPARTTFFGGGGSHPAPKSPPLAANPLPPKKGVGFLFKKLTNS